LEGIGGGRLNEGRNEREGRIDAQKRLTGPRQISPDIQRKSRESRVDFATRMVWWGGKEEAEDARSPAIYTAHVPGVLCRGQPARDGVSAILGTDSIAVSRCIGCHSATKIRHESCCWHSPLLFAQLAGVVQYASLLKPVEAAEVGAATVESGGTV